VKLKTLFSINAFLAVLVGLAAILVPSQLMGIYGFTTDAALRLMTQLFGASSLGYAVISWQARNYETDARRMLVLGMFIGYGIGVVIQLIGQFSAIASPLAWVNVVIYLLLAIGFGYFSFTEQE
jgi:hypothetical protein